jgi:ethanolamine utilization protein EutP (predicted NTPase)
LGPSPKATQRPYIFIVPEKNASKNPLSTGFFAVFKVRQIAVYHRMNFENTCDLSRRRRLLDSSGCIRFRSCMTSQGVLGWRS